MSAGIYNFLIERGSTFQREIAYEYDDEPVNLTGATAKLQVRKNKSADEVLLEFVEGDGITIDGPNGTITLSITDEDTDDIAFHNGYYDLKVIYPQGVEERLLAGRFSVSREVTV